MGIKSKLQTIKLNDDNQKKSWDELQIVTVVILVLNSTLYFLIRNDALNTHLNNIFFLIFSLICNRWLLNFDLYRYEEDKFKLATRRRKATLLGIAFRENISFPETKALFGGFRKILRFVLVASIFVLSLYYQDVIQISPISWAFGLLFLCALTPNWLWFPVLFSMFFLVVGSHQTYGARHFISFAAITLAGLQCLTFAWFVAERLETLRLNIARPPRKRRTSRIAPLGFSFIIMSSVIFLFLPKNTNKVNFNQNQDLKKVSSIQPKLTEGGGLTGGQNALFGTPRSLSNGAGSAGAGSAGAGSAGAGSAGAGSTGAGSTGAGSSGTGSSGTGSSGTGSSGTGSSGTGSSGTGSSGAGSPGADSSGATFSAGPRSSNTGSTRSVSSSEPSSANQESKDTHNYASNSQQPKTLRKPNDFDGSTNQNHRDKSQASPTPHNQKNSSNDPKKAFRKTENLLTQNKKNQVAPSDSSEKAFGKVHSPKKNDAIVAKSEVLNKKSLKSLVIISMIIIVVAFAFFILLKNRNKNSKDENLEKNLPTKADLDKATNRFKEKYRALVAGSISQENFMEIVISLYNLLLIHYEGCGLAKPNHVTPDEFHRSEYLYRTWSKNALAQVTQTFNNVFYGKEQPNLNDFTTYCNNIAKLGQMLAKIAPYKEK